MAVGQKVCRCPHQTTRSGRVGPAQSALGRLKVCLIHRYDYYVPLSPVVMLKLDGPRYGPNAHDPNAPEPIGTRTRQDFSLWETSFARHLVTLSATGYLYGLGPIINARCTDFCLRAIQQKSIAFNDEFLGFDTRHSADHGI